MLNLLKNNIVVQLDEGASMPTRQRSGDAGFDLAALHDVDVEPSKKPFKIETGVHVAIPDGFVGLVLPRSGLTLEGITVETGVIDSNYTGAISVALYSRWSWKIFKGNRIAQLVIVPCVCCQMVEGDLTNRHTERNGNGFGSTGL